MDVLLRLPLPFVFDLHLDNLSCSELIPGCDSFFTPLPMDPIHMMFIVNMVALMLDSNMVHVVFKAMLFIVILDVTFYAYFRIIERYPENDFLELFLKLLIISVSVYPFGKPRTKLCTLAIVFLLFMNFTDNPTGVIRYGKYTLSAFLVLATENRHIVDLDIQFKRAVQTLSSYWIIVILSQPRSWFYLSEWNLWNGIFVDGMNTPTRVCAMTALLLILTNYAFGIFKMFVFGRNNSNSMTNAAKITVYFFVSVLDDRVWDLEPEKRSEEVQIYLLIYLALFLSSCYDLCVSPLIALNQNNVNGREQKTKAWVLCSLILNVSIYTAYFAWSTLELSARSIILHAWIMFLILKASVEISLNVGRQFQWFSDKYDVGYLMRVTNVFFYRNNFCKKTLVSLCLIWMTVFHAVKLLRVALVLYVLFKPNTQPDICIQSLPIATSEQLAVNDDVCIVCHEDMEEACLTPCSHYYHPHCLLQWLHVNNKCPLCQTALYW